MENPITTSLYQKGVSLYEKYKDTIKDLALATHNQINKEVKKVGLSLVFTDAFDYAFLGLGIIEGSINVLPSDNILSFCKNNATLY